MMTQQRAVQAQERAFHGNSDDLRSLLCDTLRLVTGPGQGPSTRRAATVLLHDLGRNIADAYHWYHLLQAVRRDGAVAPGTEWVMKECIRAINDGTSARQPKPRRAAEVRRAWNGRTPALVM
jgi:hypothetical protein